VNVNPAFQTDELAYGLTKVGIRTLVMAEKFKKSNYVNILRSIAPEIGENNSTHIVSKHFPELKHVILCSEREERGMIKFKDLYNLPTKIDFEELNLREEIQ
jgi:fatty-acyl-CoA synthase